MKDNFSSLSSGYVRFRPGYPEKLYQYLLSLVPDTKTAWDCGTGNGQVAQQLSLFFDRVYATDISPQQIEKALPNEKIEYSVQSAENTSFPDNFFDLITVAQAIHWFDFDAFYKEVNRTIKDKGLLAVIGYGLIQIEPGIAKVISHFYSTIIGPFWDKERKYIDENYSTIPFPYMEVPSPALENRFEWSFEHLTGFLNTWSAVKHYKEQNNHNPIDIMYDDLKSSWGTATTRTVTFPLLLRITRIEK